MKFTILGSRGFIGSNLVNYLKEIGHECYTPEIRQVSIQGKDLGHVIYSIGIPNFMQRPYDAVEAHVCALKKILSTSKFKSLLYFSGTRVYYRMSSTQEEEPLVLNPLEINDLYGISKAMGESLCLAANNPLVRIVRLSNVSGNNFTSHLFLPSIIRHAIEKKKIIVKTSLNSEKDYIYIDDVVRIIPEISLRGKYKIYNVASGRNTKSRQLVNKIAEITKCQIEAFPNAEKYSFPRISIQRLQNEFQFKPINILDRIDDMITSFRDFLKNH